MESHEDHKFFENLSPEEVTFITAALHRYAREYKCNENFEKVFKKGYKYDIEALNDLEQVHTEYLYALFDEFEKTLKTCTGELFGADFGDHVENDIIKRHNTVFFWKRFKLRLTFRDYVEMLAQCTVKNDNSNIADIKNSTDEKLNEILAEINNVNLRLDKIDKQTEKQQEWETHHLAVTWKAKYQVLFNAIRKLKEKGKVDYINSKFNFKMKKGCVGLVLYNCGYNDYINAYPYILINEEPAELITLQNCTKNPEPKEWKKIQAIIQEK